jgi:hypothetical protein
LWRQNPVPPEPGGAPALERRRDLQVFMQACAQRALSGCHVERLKCQRLDVARLVFHLTAVLCGRDSQSGFDVVVNFANS